MHRKIKTPVADKVLLILILFVLGSAFAGQDCRDCHEDMQSSCNLTCVDCHVSSTAPGQVQHQGHPKIIANPSKEEYWQEKCVTCHAKEIDHFRKSLHYSSAGIIDQTRFLLGKSSAALTGNPPDSWKQLKRPSLSSARSTADLADRLLARKCLACHFSVEAGQQAEGRKRAAGCAACHIPLDQKNGKALYGHKMQRKIKDAVCLTCHSGNRVGADYYGYFEHDYHNDYQTPYGSKPAFAAFQHRLKPDLHQQAGMQCMDCHFQKEVMGNGQTINFEGQHAQAACRDCHGGFTEKAIRQSAARPVQFDKSLTAHQSFHKKVRCVACHARWTYQDYGLHLFFDQSKAYEQWADYLWQDDAEITGLLRQQLSLDPEKRKYARTTNKLSGRSMPGAWYKGWTFRRWEGLVLGKDASGFFAPLRPLYQFYITYVDSAENIWLDSRIPLRQDGLPGWSWDVYTPHTIMRRGRSCESCHGNALAAGLGIRASANDTVSHAITLPSAPILPGVRLLNKQEQGSLLNYSERYKKWRMKEFKKGGIKKLLQGD